MIITNIQKKKRSSLEILKKNSKDEEVLKCYFQMKICYTMNNSLKKKRKINEVLAKALFGMSSKGHPARVQRMRKAGEFIFKSKVTRRDSGGISKQS